MLLNLGSVPTLSHLLIQWNAHLSLRNVKCLRLLNSVHYAKWCWGVKEVCINCGWGQEPTKLTSVPPQWLARCLRDVCGIQLNDETSSWVVLEGESELLKRKWRWCWCWVTQAAPWWSPVGCSQWTPWSKSIRLWSPSTPISASSSAPVHTHSCLRMSTYASSRWADGRAIVSLGRCKMAFLGSFTAGKM